MSGAQHKSSFSNEGEKNLRILMSKRRKHPKSIKFLRMEATFHKTPKKYQWFKFNRRIDEDLKERLVNFKRLGHSGDGLKIRFHRPSKDAIFAFVKYIFISVVTFRIFFIKTLVKLFILAIKRREYGVNCYIIYYVSLYSLLSWSLYHNVPKLIASTPKLQAFVDFIIDHFLTF